MSAKQPVKKPKVSKPAFTKTSNIVAICNDIHFDAHDPQAWGAFRAWHKDIRPSKTVILGDFLDLGMMSRYVQGGNDPLFAIPQIQMFVKEANEMAKECGELVVVEGNHDERWTKMVLGNLPHIYNGAIGLSLQEQCRAQGLHKSISWLREDTVIKGLRCGPFLLRHGHNQSGRFGGGKHLAANRLMRTMGQSEVFGHHHQAQMMCQTSQGRTAIAIASPHLSGDHDYNKDPNWQKGFTILELYGPDNKFATPHLIVMSEGGHFAWNGRVYSGE